MQQQTIGKSFPSRPIISDGAKCCRIASFSHFQNCKLISFCKNFCFWRFVFWKQTTRHLGKWMENPQNVTSVWPKSNDKARPISNTFDLCVPAPVKTSVWVKLDQPTKRVSGTFDTEWFVFCTFIGNFFQHPEYQISLEKTDYSELQHSAFFYLPWILYRAHRFKGSPHAWLLKTATDLYIA